MTADEIKRALAVMRDTNRIPSRTLMEATLELIEELERKSSSETDTH